jgi:hypothetical protein
MKLGRRWLITVVTLSLLSFVSIKPTHAAPFQPGQIFVAYGGDKIGVFADTVSLAGTQVMSPIPIASSTFGTDTILTGGGGVALDELGNLYVTVQNFKEQTNLRGVVKIDRNGNIVLEIDGGTTTIDFRGVAVHDGIIYVASGSGIRRFRADNGASISPIIASGTSFRDVAFDRQGNLYALLSNEVRRWSTDFSQYSSFSIPNEDPRAIVLDEDGNIYITFEDKKLIRKYSPNGNLIATYYAYSDLSKVGSLIGLDYDPGTQRLFASHTATGGIGQILWIDRNAPSGATMNAFGPNNLSGVRWLAVYPTSEPAAAVLLLAGLGWLVRRVRRRS